jgi:hypothetical protein
MDLMASAIEAFYLFKQGIYRNGHKGREGIDSLGISVGRRGRCGE